MRNDYNNDKNIYYVINLFSEKEIPFTFKYIGTHKNIIVGIINDKENQKNICLLEQY